MVPSGPDTDNSVTLEESVQTPDVGHNEVSVLEEETVR